MSCQKESPPNKFSCVLGAIIEASTLQLLA